MYVVMSNAGAIWTHPNNAGGMTWEEANQLKASLEQVTPILKNTSFTIYELVPVNTYPVMPA